MKIAIIGCGYIGSELAKELTKQKHFITCTTKSPESIKKISKNTQKSIIMLGDDERGMSLILKENDVIIITVSAGLHEDFENTYLQTAHTIKNCAYTLDKPKTIIYTSKSSLYGDHGGMWVDESSSLNAKDEESKILIDTENTIFSLNDLDWQVCILRLAQIYGPGRSIIDLFKSIYKEVIPGHGEYYTNMVHQQDVVGIINYVLDHDIRGIFNVADDEHPTREEFAKTICLKLDLKVPKFDPKLADFPDNNKRVSNYRIKEKGYNFKYPNRLL